MHSQEVEQLGLDLTGAPETCALNRTYQPLQWVTNPGIQQDGALESLHLLV